MKLGADYLGDGRCVFTVWAPLLKEVSVAITAPQPRRVALAPQPDGYWSTACDGIPPGAEYRFVLDGRLERPDPASDAQPHGVHGASRVIDHAAHHWRDHGWHGLPPAALVIYELHVGTFTPQGTFDAIIPRLPQLAALGVTALELMPVAQFPGERNWGYDGVFPFAAQQSYGGVDGLKRLVDACHAAGLAVILDVVYNHLGPEGNYLAEFGPYFTDKHCTPWGRAMNFDDAYSDGVRAYFIANARHWLERFHLDGLRLDAIHGIYDMSAQPFLRQLADDVAQLSAATGWRRLLIAESDLNDPRVTRPAARGGLGLDAQWNDDLHHALHVLLTGEEEGYYADFGRVADVAAALRAGFARPGAYSHYRKRRHGASAADRPGAQFVAFLQNHDQIGNRLFGERLAGLVSFEALKVGAAAVLLAPFIPMLFMGEEYGEPAPFLYFISHTDPELIEAVRRGRRQEFARFTWSQDPPDPQAESTFQASKLTWERRALPPHAPLLAFYTALLRLRRTLPALARLDKEALEATADESRRVLRLRRRAAGSDVIALFSFNRDEVAADDLAPPAPWSKRLDSSDAEWNGPGTRLPRRLRPFSVALYAKEG